MLIFATSPCARGHAGPFLRRSDAPGREREGRDAGQCLVHGPADRGSHCVQSQQPAPGRPRAGVRERGDSLDANDGHEGCRDDRRRRPLDFLHSGPKGRNTKAHRNITSTKAIFWCPPITQIYADEKEGRYLAALHSLPRGPRAPVVETLRPRN